jgi:hypothetical protein
MPHNTALPRNFSSMIRTKVAEVQSELPSNFPLAKTASVGLAPDQLAGLADRYPAFGQLAEMLVIAEALRGPDDATEFPSLFDACKFGPPRK